MHTTNPQREPTMHLTDDYLTEITQDEHKFSIGYARTTIDPGRPTFVFIHGWLGDRSHFAPSITEFESNYNILALDLRGHGVSDSPLDINWSFEAFADDIYALISSYDLDKVTIIGYSLGTAIALKFVNKYPELVERLILIAGANKFEPPYWFRAVAKLGIDALTKSITSLLDRLLPLLTDKREIDFVRDVIARFRSTDMSIHRKVLFDSILVDGLEEECRNISQPVLLIAGDEDLVVSFHSSLALHELLPNSSLVVFHGESHWLIHTQSKQINWLIKLFQETPNTILSNRFWTAKSSSESVSIINNVDFGR